MGKEWWGFTQGENSEKTTPDSATDRRSFLRGASGLVLASAGVMGSTQSAIAAPNGSATGERFLLGTTRPGSLYQYESGNWEQRGGQLTNDDGSITDIVEYQGTLYAGATTDPRQGSGTGTVYAYENNDWVEVGDSLQDEVTTLAIYADSLYAGTSYGTGVLYEYEGGSSWTEVFSESSLDGISASKVWDGKLFVGDSLHDIFGYYDGSGYHEEADRGGSCVFAIESHNGDLYAGAEYGYLYKRNGGSWDRISSGFGGANYTLASYQGTLYVGDQDNRLRIWNETQQQLETVHEFQDSVVALTPGPDGLYVGIGQNAAEYEGGYRDEGTSAVYRWADGSAEGLSDINAFGSAAQVIYQRNRQDVSNVEYPDSAVETDERPTFRLTLDDVSMSSVSIDTQISISTRGEPVTTVSPEDVSRESDNGSVTVEVTAPSAEAGSISAEVDDPKGVGYNFEVSVTANGVSAGTYAGKSFVFEHVTPLAVIPAKAHDTDTDFLPASGDPLFEGTKRGTAPDGHVGLRTQMERLNEFLASGVGSMGAHGMRPVFITEGSQADAVEEGWVEMSLSGTDFDRPAAEEQQKEGSDDTKKEKDEYNHSSWDGGSDQETSHEHDLNPKQRITNEALEKVESSDAIDLESIDTPEPGPTALVMYGPGIADDTRDGDGHPGFGLGGVLHPCSASHSDAVLNTVVVRMGEAHLRHEIGHRTGFEDLYWRSLVDSSGESRIRVLGDWGIMAGGDVYSTYSKAFFGWEQHTYSSAGDPSDKRNCTQDPVDDVTPDTDWLDTSIQEVTAGEEKTLSLSELSDQRFGDTIEYVGVEYEATVTREVEDGVYKAVQEMRTPFYLPEARRATDSGHLTQPPIPADTDGSSVSLSGDHHDGVVLYWLSENDPNRHSEDADAVAQYLPSSHIGDQRKSNSYSPITLTTAEERNADQGIPIFDQPEYYYDVRYATLFELKNGFNDGNPDLEVEQTIDPTVDSGAAEGVATISVGVGNSPALEALTVDGAANSTPRTEPLPPLDVQVRMDDGRTIGTDPQSGEVINEIESGRVSGTLTRRHVTVPLREAGSIAEVAVSADRLKAAIRERGKTPPAEIPYDQELIIEDDPTLTTEDGVTRIEGRQKIKTASTTDADSTTRPIVANANVTLEPSVLRPKSNGKFVTTYMRFTGDVDPTEVQLSSVVMNGVHAVDDEQYGFVKNPPAERRDGEEAVMVKFPRKDVIDSLDVGRQELTVSGVVGDTPFIGSGTVELKSPKQSKKNGENKSKGRKGGS